MKEQDLTKFYPILNGEKPTYSQPFKSYKTSRTVILIVFGILLVAFDCFFLGATLVLSIFNSIKGINIAVFSVKLILDFIFITAWYFFSSEKSLQEKSSKIIITENFIFLACLKYEEITFISFDKTKVEIKDKKIFGGISLEFVEGSKRKKAKFSGESKKLLRLLDIE